MGNACMKQENAPVSTKMENPMDTMAKIVLSKVVSTTAATFLVSYPSVNASKTFQTLIVSALRRTREAVTIAPKSFVSTTVQDTEIVTNWVFASV
jgi:hypothetical protein